MKVVVKNLELTYPILTGDSFLGRKSLIKKITDAFKFNKKTVEKTFSNENKGQIYNLKALKGINFELKPGDRLGLMGLNGSGKSSLIKCLSNILPADDGSEINIEGSYLPIISPIHFCEREDTVLNNLITVGLLLGFKKDEVIKNAREILDFAEIKNYQNFPFASLSTGMGFRLISSICFILKRDNYFIDEFLTTGDEKFQNKSFKVIDERSKGNIIVLCSHSQRMIEKFCNKILILNKGEQVYFGDISEGLNEYRKIINKN